MTMTTEKTVRDLALEFPAAPRVFEKLGIDYCCGGGKTLEQACNAANLPLDEVVEALESARRNAQPESAPRDWNAEPLAELITHIQNTHHRYTREETVRLTALAAKVAQAHGANHPELAEIRDVFAGLAQELSSHLMKEEMILFPYIVRLENSGQAAAPFGTVRNPIAMMMHEHDGAGDALRELRRLSGGYTAPADACVSYHTLYRSLAAFEEDLHQHIHLENNILFPRAMELERTRQA